MIKKLLQILIFILVLSLCKTDNAAKCHRNVGDSTSCYFEGAKSVYHFYTSLNELKDEDKAKIIRVSFRDCELTNLPREMTDKYTNIKEIDASRIYLWRLEGNDFAYGSPVEKLNASYNKIHRLPEDMTQRVKQLINLDLAHNVIDMIEAEAFEEKNYIKYLNLSFNRIGRLTRDFLYPVRNLETLKLDNNRITEIENIQEYQMLNIKEIHLQNNNLRSFDVGLLNTTAYLDLSNNELNDDIDFANTQLSELKIGGNLLTGLSVSKNLQKLDVSSNRERTFTLLIPDKSAMTELKLSNLEISSYESIFSTIKSLGNLKHLDLSDNSFDMFDFQQRKLPQSLEFLNLQGSSIHTMRNWKSLKSLLPQLKEINILRNFLACKELPEMLSAFKDMKINVTGLAESSESEFISKNCAEEHQRKKSKVCEAPSDAESVNKFLLAVMVTLLIGNVLGLFFYINKRYNLIQHLTRKSNSGLSFTNYPRTALISDGDAV